MQVYLFTWHFSWQDPNISQKHTVPSHTNEITNNIPHNEQEKWLPCFPQSKATMESKTGWLIIKLKIRNGIHPPMMRDICRIQMRQITVRVPSCIEPWCGTQSLQHHSMVTPKACKERDGDKGSMWNSTEWLDINYITPATIPALTLSLLGTLFCQFKFLATMVSKRVLPNQNWFFWDVCSTIGYTKYWNSGRMLYVTKVNRKSSVTPDIICHKSKQEKLC